MGSKEGKICYASQKGGLAFLPFLPVLLLISLFLLYRNLIQLAFLSLIIFLVIAVVVFLYSSVKLQITSEGLHYWTFFSEWKLHWSDIENWSVRPYIDDDSDLYFRLSGSSRKFLIPSSDFDYKDMQEIRMKFRTHVGDSIDYESFVTQFDELDLLSSTSR